MSEGRVDKRVQTSADLQKQLNFIRELDKLKQVMRQNYLLDASRPENSAEHSWHAALTAFILRDCSNQPVDICKVGKMLLIHDVIEIQAGDTYIYDPLAEEGQHERELTAAEDLFGLLPSKQKRELMDLWLEFEERKTADARFAKAVDRFMPMLANYESQGLSWQENGVTSQRIREICSLIEEGSTVLWEYAEGMIASALERGYLNA